MDQKQSEISQVGRGTRRKTGEHLSMARNAQDTNKHPVNVMEHPETGAPKYQGKLREALP